MKILVFGLLVLQVVFVVCEKSFIGFDVVVIKKDDLEEKLRDLFGHHQNLIDEKISSLRAEITKMYNSRGRIIEDLSVKLDEIHSKLSERIVQVDALGSSIMQNHKSLKDQNSAILANVSFIANNTRKMLDNQYGLLIKPCIEPIQSGVFQMQNPKIKLYCEMEKFGGGWIVFQQRIDHTLNFNRSWAEYRAGFGTIEKNSDFWLGLEVTHQLTKTGNCELAVEMMDNNGTYQYARYSMFELAAEDEKYRLKVGNYSGTAGDQLERHNDMKFTTYDSDNDTWYRNCALYRNSGWWFRQCFRSNLNFPDGGRWTDDVSSEFKLSYSRMLLRCR